MIWGNGWLVTCGNPVDAAKKFPFHGNEQTWDPKKSCTLEQDLPFSTVRDFFWCVPVNFPGSRELFGESQEAQKPLGTLKLEDQIELGGDEIY